MYKIERFLIRIFLFLCFSVYSCIQTTKDPNLKIFYKISFLLESSLVKVCVLKIQKNEFNPSSICSAEFAFKNDSCRVLYFSNLDSNSNKEKFLHSQFLKILSELELKDPNIKDSLNSIFIVTYEKEFLNKQKEFQKEFESSLKRYKLNLNLQFLKEEEELKNYSENLEKEFFLLHSMKNSQSKFFLKNPQTNKDLQFQEEFSAFLVERKNEEKKDFVACRQALSEKIRSTGKSGVENAMNCKGLILNSFNQTKTLSNIKKILQENQIKKFYLQGEDWDILREIEKSENLEYWKLLEKQKDYCYLSPWELINKYKISKRVAKSACYSLMFGISFFDFFDIEKAKVLDQSEFLRLASIYPKFVSECDTNPPLKKK